MRLQIDIILYFRQIYRHTFSVRLTADSLKKFDSYTYKCIYNLLRYKQYEKEREKMENINFEECKTNIAKAVSNNNNSTDCVGKLSEFHLNALRDAGYKINLEKYTDDFRGILFENSKFVISWNKKK